MGMELEFKLAVSHPAKLEKILFDEQIAQVRQGGYDLLDMATVYYDTADRAMAARNWTLRLRQENETRIATLKTPAPGRARNEYECAADSITAAIGLLVEQGAPAELAELTGSAPLQPVCAARFTRRAAELSFADGTVCELCGDVGTLIGGIREEDFCEVELELKSGDAETVAAFAEELQERFDLQEEHRSKFARAAALARREDGR